MMILAVVSLVVLIWILLEWRTSRPDGFYLGKVHPYRRLMPFVMRKRNESFVFFERPVRAEKLLEYVAEAKKFGADISHCIIAACAIGLAENPTMNLFVSGKRLYRRKGIHLSFSMKRKMMDRKAKIAVVKKRIRLGETFRQFCERVNADIQVQRTDRTTPHDKEYNLLIRLPRPLLSVAAAFLRCLDYYGLLPGAFINGDGMYASAFVANLGSLGMSAGFHHLYEWGNCSHFVMAGRIEDRPVVEDGQIVIRKILPFRFTYDERIEDGLGGRFGIDTMVRCLENPYESLGCLKNDGSDARVLCTLEQSQEVAERFPTHH